MSRNRKDKPCSICIGVKMTWANCDDFTICDKHRGEIIRGMSLPQPNALGTGALQ